MEPIGVVDVFAGPGGLGEGFCPISADSEWPFTLAASIEKEAAAHQTLLLRSFLRKFGGTLPKQYYEFLNRETSEPDWGTRFPNEWQEAENEARCLTLGDPDSERFLEKRISEVRKEYRNRTVLLGGPPCQAYSLAGRVRNASISGYLVHKDERTRLYEKYIDVLKRLEPAFFVMENVKGMLSATSQGERIFERVLSDLRDATSKGYKLVPLASVNQNNCKKTPYTASDFIVRAEDFGVPQARHRVFIVGIRADIARHLPEHAWPRLEDSSRAAPSVRETIDGMPRLRSGISRRDSLQAWKSSISKALDLLSKNLPELSKEERSAFRSSLKQLAGDMAHKLPSARRGEDAVCGVGRSACIDNWLLDEQLTRLPNHETRSHMQSDLSRYLFASVFASVTARSPKAKDFPAVFSPAHRNWCSGSFADRFRVQVASRPSTTITSHISKDGHYYIHYDPLQCRSLTVREAARLQTFPDNYLFKGNRTQQYVQVGNAVPPYLANQVAKAIMEAFFQLDTETMNASSVSPDSADAAWG